MSTNSQHQSILSLVRQHSEWVPTNWFVLTGPPCSGKTTSLLRLHMAGYNTNPDITRQYIEEQKRRSRSPEVQRADEMAFQRNVFDLMVRNALGLPAHQTVIHDYALPDNIAFLRLSGLPISEEVWASARMFLYRGVFIFEPLELRRDGVRTETEREQLALFSLIMDTYVSLGYRPIRVRKDSIENRHRFLLSNLPPSQCSVCTTCRRA